MEALLLWLNQPENNTDNNCRRVDSSVSYEIISEPRYKELPEDIRGILFDMGATLHDTHTSSQIAENFESKPDQLLERVRKLRESLIRYADAGHLAEAGGAEHRHE